jgi:hypothetical protein
VVLVWSDGSGFGLVSVGLVGLVLVWSGWSGFGLAPAGPVGLVFVLFWSGLANTRLAIRVLHAQLQSMGGTVRDVKEMPRPSAKVRGHVVPSHISESTTGTHHRCPICCECEEL